MRFMGFGVVRLIGVDPGQARVGDITVEVAHSGFHTRAQRPDSRTDGRDGDDTWKHTPGNLETEDGSPLSCKHGTNERRMVEESDSDSDSSESSDEGTQLVGPGGGESEFGDTEFEDLVKKEGPHQILQLTMQNKTDDLLKEELTDVDDYANWIQWATDEEQRMQSLSEEANATEESVLL
ncbi:unnamed protein product [Sphagnum jensenii]|uniref:Uncharacterized protein n=2 Tax=Sphagnum jensenii TaxID=128206 RepID=A0ABP0ZWX8_9BRYO